MKYLLVGLIKIYQMIPSPWHNYCRHIPTCSNYAIESIKKYGAFTGSILSIKRILRCSPWGTYGYDPVPELKENKNEKI